MLSLYPYFTVRYSPVNSFKNIFYKGFINFRIAHNKCGSKLANIMQLLFNIFEYLKKKLRLLKVK